MCEINCSTLTAIMQCRAQTRRLPLLQHESYFLGRDIFSKAMLKIIQFRPFRHGYSLHIQHNKEKLFLAHSEWKYWLQVDVEPEGRYWLSTPPRHHDTRSQLPPPLIYPPKGRVFSAFRAAYRNIKQGFSGIHNFLSFKGLSGEI